MTDWKLVEVDDVDCTLDDSGLYVVINRIETQDTHKGISGVRVIVRADLMLKNEPVRSFIGKANDVRKALIGYMAEIYWPQCKILDLPQGVSFEHASYIGWELHRAETTPGYVQD